jgi:hypothetical protein
LLISGCGGEQRQHGPVIGRHVVVRKVAVDHHDLRLGVPVTRRTGHKDKIQ